MRTDAEPELIRVTLPAGLAVSAGRGWFTLAAPVRWATPHWGSAVGLADTPETGYGVLLLAPETARQVWSMLAPAGRRRPQEREVDRG